MSAFLPGFTKRKAIKYGTSIPSTSDLVDFAKLFLITNDSNIGAELTSQKFAFTLADGVTQVPYGALFFNSSGGLATLKARAKYTLSHTASVGDILGYIYYTNIATDQSNKSGVLDANTVVYWPCEEDPSGSPPQIESWEGTNNGTVQGSLSSGDLVPVQVANGLQFSTGNYVKSSTFSAITNQLHLSVIFQGATQAASTTPLVGRGVLTFYIGTATGSDLTVSGYMSDTNFFSLTVDASFFDGSNKQVDVTYDGSNIKVYLNGSFVTSTPATADIGYNGTVPFDNLSLGGGINNTYTGVGDELLLRNAPATLEEIAYRYTDQFSNSNTFTLGSEETASVLHQFLAIKLSIGKYLLMGK